MGERLVRSRILFRLKSKGRHGTHSPFAYAFVEQVLRPKHLSKEQQLQKIIALIGYENVFANKMTATHSLKEVVPFTDFKSITTLNNVIILEAQKVNSCGDWAELPFESFCVIKNPRANINEVNHLLKNHQFSLVIDAWDWLIISNVQAFKRKRFFRLR